MTDLADLAARVTAEGVDETNRKLDNFVATASKAEKANDALANSGRRSKTATDRLNESINGAATATDRLAREEMEAVAAMQAHARATQMASNVQVVYARTAGLTRFEMLNLGRQFADVGVSIASGMPVWLLAIQQGSQIGEVFAEAKTRGVGLGTAVRSLTGSLGGVASAMGPWILLGGAIATVGAAMLAVEKDANNFENALALTGRTAGVTASELEAMSQRIASSMGSGMGSARSSLLALVRTGEFSRETLELLGASAVRLADYTGQSADEIAKDFAQMSDGVADYAADFARAHGGITLAQLEYIRSLEERGQTEEATLQAAIAMHESLGEIGPKNLGFLEQAWDSVADAIGRAWDQLRKFGQDPGPEARLQRQIKSVGNRIAHFQQFFPDSGELADLKEQRAELQRRLDAIREANRLEAENNRIQREGAEAAKRMWTKWASMGDNLDKANAEIEAYRRDIELIRKADPHSALLPSVAEQRAAEEDIRKRYMPDAYRASHKRDMNDEFGARIDQQIAQAKGGELQALIALTHNISARADFEKQVVDQSLAAQQAQLVAQAERIKDTKGLSDPVKKQLLGELEAVAEIQEHVAALKKRAVDDDLAEQLRRAGLDQLRQQADLQQRVLAAQAGMATSLDERQEIERRILALRQREEARQFAEEQRQALRDGRIGVGDYQANLDAFGRAQGAEEAALRHQQALDMHPLQKWLEELPSTTADASRGLEDLAVRGFGSVEDALADLMLNMNDADDVLRNFGRALLNELARYTAHQTMGGAGDWVRAGMSLFNATFGNAGAQMSADVAAMQAANDAFAASLPGFARGTDFAPGGLAVVGERGPEIVNLPRGSQVIPNEALRGSVSNDNTSSGGDVTINNYGEPVDAHVRRQNGQTVIDLRPLREATRGGVRAAFADGTAQKAARFAPQPTLRP